MIMLLTVKIFHGFGMHTLEIIATPNIDKFTVLEQEVKSSFKD